MPSTHHVLTPTKTHAHTPSTHHVLYNVHVEEQGLDKILKQCNTHITTHTHTHTHTHNHTHT